ncbi:5-oxoprolinase subunit B family protein [Nocardioides bruguierae]|uniref:Allophanate hydrolase subunit 1 n=1 Tax=Nocardioides bruguierae TaxID=2945102 RepID=A0A9X2D463_9ACTN|nr:allophanate hydrolase subunit 1 [Nocardioides bruguierae]MCM0618725.1 allophanate hydrolase subunit 1 [Nocardioides bruguierae]
MTAGRVPGLAPAFLPAGPTALLVDLPGAAAGEAASLAAHVRAGSVAAGLSLLDVVPGAATVLLDGLDLPAELGAVRALVASWSPSRHGDVAPGRLVEVPVVYDGEDLADVAGAWGCSVEEVVARHTGAELVSAFCGFAPGFAYLTGLGSADPRRPGETTWPWSVPRRASPRPRVPAGSVALAGGWCGVYPTASPGGWQLIGRTDLDLWDVAADQPALLAPGTRVRFVAVR